MSYQVVFEKESDDLSIDFTVNEDQIVNSISLKLYLHNDPTGNVNIILKEGSNVIDTISTTLADIISTAGFNSNEYHYGYFNFSLSNRKFLKADVTYSIVLNTSSYTFSESSYFGWIRPHEDDPNENTDSLGYKLFGYLTKEVI